MEIILFLISAWFILGAVYALLIISYLDKYAAEWFIKYHKVKRKKFSSEVNHEIVMNLSLKECYGLLVFVAFFGLLILGPLGIIIAPYKEIVPDIKIWKNAGRLHHARTTTSK